LIHHITNFVTAGDVADVTLALGAAPVMGRALEEVEELAAQAGALVLNTGTLTVEAVPVMILAGHQANARGVPVVLDPVGAGGTAFRSAQIARILAEVRCACVRGNAGEIAALGGRAGGVRGVDASGPVGDLEALARSLAGKTRGAIAATGREDLLTDGTTTVRIANGDPLLARITGSGCMATAAVAVAAAIEPDPLAAAVAGLVWFEVAAERAAEQAAGPGTFRVALIDAVAALDHPAIVSRARIAVA
jgi:hydroxyethylthiazole kinase